jgi:hypothetical protein
MKMPGMTIEVNGIRIATIDLTGMEVLDVSVYGALDSDPKAALTAMGSNGDHDGRGNPVWLFDHALLAGEVLSVRMTEPCGSADRGKSIDELFPDEPPSGQTDFTITADMAAEIRSRPRLHEAFIVQAEISSGQQAMAASDELNTCFTFGLLWNCFRPDRARIRLETYCLDDVLARRAGTKHLQANLSIGESASFSLVA